jgi:CheY-like chemotaxis protein
MTAAHIAVRGNVLVVDDDSDCRELIHHLLETEGYHVKVVCSREAALLALKQKRYDHLILDVVMPGMSIQEFIEKLPSTTVRNIIIISAVVDPQETANRINVRTWLRKPFDPAQLLEIMNRSGAEL